MNRKIILDVETTGFSYADGDKVVEVACVEFFNDTDFGKEFHYYINPQRNIPDESARIHGITNQKVENSPIFKDIAQQLVDFIADSPIIAHNAEFDRGFINGELKDAINFAGYPKSQCIDTLVLAKQKFPALKNSLDALASRFNIDLSAREEFHGALIDVRLLGLVYTKLINHTAQDFSLDSMFASSSGIKEYTNTKIFNRQWQLTAKELELHNAIMEKINK